MREPMHIKAFLHKTLFSVMHLKRLETLKQLVLSALKNKQISVTSLGRGLAGKASERSNIRKSDRFIGNLKLITERKFIYEAIVKLLVGGKIRPWIIVDWSHIPNTTNYVLRASLVACGRALTLYEEVYTKTMENHPKAHKKFLLALKRILPKNCRPIIITDAGFHNPWFREVLALSWDYVGRVRGKTCYQKKGEHHWQACSSLHAEANSKGKYIGEIELCKTASIITHGYLIKQKKKGRVNLNKLGKKSHYKSDIEHSKSANEPWLLVSSLEQNYHINKTVFKIYKTRMQIEEGFRDLKSSKYGFSFEKANSKSIARIEVLLLIAMLAALSAWLTGAFAEKMGWQYQFQANSTKKRRVLSLFFLGCRIIKKKITIPIEEFLQLIENEELPLCTI